MRRQLTAVMAVLLLAGCGAEQVPIRRTPDSTAAAAAGEHPTAVPGDSLTPRADSIMVRDTAQVP